MLVSPKKVISKTNVFAYFMTKIALILLCRSHTFSDKVVGFLKWTGMSKSISIVVTLLV